MRLLIDTNFYSYLERSIASAVEVFDAHDSVALTFASIAELKAGFLGGRKAAKNLIRLEKFLSKDETEIFFADSKTTDLYAELFDYARKRGRVLSNNDLWIAALAWQHDARLASYDRDFEVFADILGDKLVILSD